MYEYLTWSQTDAFTLAVEKVISKFEITRTIFKKCIKTPVSLAASIFNES